MTEKRGLRKFGVSLAALVVVFGSLLPFWRHHQWHVWPCWLGGLLLVLAVFYPESLKHLATAWEALGEFIGAVNIRLVLGVFFLVVIVPIGLARKLIGTDKMKRQFSMKAKSYRIERLSPPPREQMERIF